MSTFVHLSRPLSKIETFSFWREANTSDSSFDGRQIWIAYLLHPDLTGNNETKTLVNLHRRLNKIATNLVTCAMFVQYRYSLHAIILETFIQFIHVGDQVNAALSAVIALQSFESSHLLPKISNAKYITLHYTILHLEYHIDNCKVKAAQFLAAIPNHGISSRPPNSSDKQRFGPICLL